MDSFFNSNLLPSIFVTSKMSSVNLFNLSVFLIIIASKSFRSLSLILSFTIFDKPSIGCIGVRTHEQQYL